MYAHWRLSSFTPGRCLAVGGQDACSYPKEEVYFNPTVYRISQTTKNYESYNVNNVDVEENYGLKERERT